MLCEHCGGPTAFRQWGDRVAVTDDDQLVTYRAVCLGNCSRFQETAEAISGPDGEYAVWESRY
jgi:hypothetical protein